MASTSAARAARMLFSVLSSIPNSVAPQPQPQATMIPDAEILARLPPDTLLTIKVPAGALLKAMEGTEPGTRHPLHPSGREALRLAA